MAQAAARIAPPSCVSVGGSAGRGLLERMMSDARYDSIGEGYALRRRADSRIASAIENTLGDAATIVNVGAGTGSYEPAGKVVQAVEPSAMMISQRPADAPPCVQASAESLPFPDNSFAAAMAVMTIHHWADWRAGLREMKRVARRVVLLTFDAEASDFWLTHDYFPQLAALDREIMPALGQLAEELGDFQCTPVPVPHDCQDGFLGAYWRRPHVYLDPLARRSMSSFARINAEEGLNRLARDLESGSWRERYGRLLDLDSLDIGYRLLRWDFS